MEEMAKLFRGSLVPRIEALKAAKKALGKNQEAADSVRRIAHTLKGAGAANGFPEISQAAAALEVAESDHITDCLENLLSILEDLSAGFAPEEKAVILIVENDQQMARLLERILSSPGREIFISRSAWDAGKVLEEVKVSLVILDLLLPDTDGRNFLMHLREHAGTASLPVVVLSAMGGSQPKTECFGLGADAYFEKPLAPEVLKAAVSSILHKAELNRRESRQDSLTGLPNRAAFYQDFIRQVSLGSRKKEPISICMLDFDRFKFINDTFGHAMGDDVLRQSGRILANCMRKSDLLARWGGDKFVILLPNTSLGGAKSALSKSLSVLREEPFRAMDGRTVQISFSAGLAQVSEGVSVEEAIAEADRFLYMAKAKGRNCVMTAQDKLPLPHKRVLLVEEDEEVATVIRYRLGREGIEVLHFTLAAPALDVAVTIPFSLCILDGKKPASQGYDLITQLRSYPNSYRIPILMLTSLGKEKDVAHGFDWGADDYLVKPFSPYELLARVHNLLKKV